MCPCIHAAPVIRALLSIHAPPPPRRAPPPAPSQAYLNGKFGAFYPGGGGNLLACQVTGIVVITAWVMVQTGALFFVLKMFGLLRISPEEEQAGLDVSKHGGSAYNYDGGLSGGKGEGHKI